MVISRALICNLGLPRRPFPFILHCVVCVMDYAMIHGFVSFMEDLIADGQKIRNVCNSDFSVVCWLHKGSSSVVHWFRKFSVFMASTTELTTSSNPSLSFSIELTEIHRKLRRKKRYLQHMDVKGERRLEIVDRDLTHLREEFMESLSQTERAMTTMLTDLEICFEKLELQVAR